jgi:hypothetical protein
MRLRDAEQNWQRIGRGIWQQHVRRPTFAFITDNRFNNCYLAYG